MERYIDLHIHTSCSDGALSPAEVLDRVRATKLAAFAIADHDTVDGYKEISRLRGDNDPELISGVELSATHEGEDVHMLAYLFDSESEAIGSALKEFQEKRNQRGRLIVEKLGELGLQVPFEAVLKAANHSVVGRPHIAEAMKDQKVTKSYEEAFRKYIGKDGPAYVPKLKFTPAQVFELVHGAGGVAVLAHPMLDNCVRFVEELADAGLDGLEIYHYTANTAGVRRLKQMAKRLNLALSGGSDFHGREGRNEAIGSQKVPAEYLETLKERAQQIRGQN
jgi:hypothetical protein